jgi:hypothetical protein
MYLPERLHHRRFAEWNYLVRGLVEVWEIARLVGLEEQLEQRLAEDRDGSLTEMLGEIGNECASLAGRLNAYRRLLKPHGRLRALLVHCECPSDGAAARIGEPAALLLAER